MGTLSAIVIPIERILAVLQGDHDTVVIQVLTENIECLITTRLQAGQCQTASLVIQVTNGI